MQSLARFKTLRVAYNRAFEQLSSEVRLLQAEQERRGDMLNELQSRVFEAELNYRKSRNELAQFLMDQLSETEHMEQVCA